MDFFNKNKFILDCYDKIALGGICKIYVEATSYDIHNLYKTYSHRYPSYFVDIIYVAKNDHGFYVRMSNRVSIECDIFYLKNVKEFMLKLIPYLNNLDAKNY